MQSAGVALPFHFAEIVFQTGDEPDIAVHRNGGGASVGFGKERDVGEPDVALPRIRQRQRDVVNDVSVVFLRKRGVRGDGFGPVRFFRRFEFLLWFFTKHNCT